MSSASELSRGRRGAALAIPLAVILGVVVVVNFMSPSQVAFWFGETVDHCPQSELSCPSQSPGVFFLVLTPAVILIILLEDGDE